MLGGVELVAGGQWGWSCAPCKTVGEPTGSRDEARDAYKAHRALCRSQHSTEDSTMTGPEATPAVAPEAPAAAAAPKAKPAPKPAPKAAPKKAAPKAAPKKAAPKVDEPGLNKTQAEDVLARLADGSRLEKEQKRLGFSSIAAMRKAMGAYITQPVYRKAVTKGRAVLAKKAAGKK